MYTITIDGKMLYQTGAEDEAQIALNVKPSLDIESAGCLSFVLTPGNAQYDAIRKMKSIVTMHQDGKQIFRGRVTETEKDIFNQKTVYCEGDRSFLLDSLWEEQTVQGKVQDLFRQLIDNHNGQVESDKQFTVGIITAEDAETPYEGEMRIETRRHWDTSTILDERLLSVYGGYIRTRTEGDVTYIDWLKDFEEESGQEIRFSVNMLDLKDKLDAKDVFTCLIPLGYSEIQDDGTYSDPVNITSVNDGLEYIQDDEGIALYGKIWRSKTWGATKDPAVLKEKALEYLKTGGEVRTLTLKAVDMHFVYGSISMLTIGKKVQIESDPHGISLNMVLAKMDIDPDNPENSEYTFGVKPRTLSEAVIRAEKESGRLSGRGGGGGRKGIEEEAQDILRWAKISVDEANAKINLNAGEINNLTGRMSTAEIAIDGANANISLNASAIDNVTGRVSSAEIVIDGLNSEITLKADKVYVDAEITTVKTLIADEIQALYSDVNYSIAESISTKALTVHNDAWIGGTMAASGVSCGTLTLGGDSISKTTLSVITGISGGGIDTTLLTTRVGDSYTVQAGSADAVYSNGAHAKYIQGEEYTSPLYEPGSSTTIKKQGDLLTAALYYGGTQRTFKKRGSSTDYNLYRTSSVDVKVQGSAYTSNKLYISTGGVYRELGQTLYTAGSTKTYYTRERYADAGELYWSDGDETVYVQGEEYTSPLYEPGSSVTIKEQGNLLETALYRQGTQYSGGLYTNFEPAVLTLQDVTALTA